MRKIKIFFGLWMWILTIYNHLAFSAPHYSNSTPFQSCPINQLKTAYPDSIKRVSSKMILFKNGQRLYFDLKKELTESHQKRIEDKISHPNFIDSVCFQSYPKGKPANIKTFTPKNSPGRIRYLPFFEKMYGKSQKEIEQHLTTLYWLPHYLNKRYPIQVTQINQVDKKIQRISNELEQLLKVHPDYLIFLSPPGGGYCYRRIFKTNRLSPHSFGIAMDINATQSQYHERDKIPYYHNQVPWEIILIFEKYHFVWGGKWKEYDTMHFEYRPELF